MVIIERGSSTDEKTVLFGKGPVKFEYKGHFFGIPLSNSSFYSYPKILRPSQTQIAYSRTEI